MTWRRHGRATFFDTANDVQYETSAAWSSDLEKAAAPLDPASGNPWDKAKFEAEQRAKKPDNYGLGPPDWQESLAGPGSIEGLPEIADYGQTAADVTLPALGGAVGAYGGAMLGPYGAYAGGMAGSGLGDAAAQWLGGKSYDPVRGAQSTAFGALGGVGVNSAARSGARNASRLKTLAGLDGARNAAFPQGVRRVGQVVEEGAEQLSAATGRAINRGVPAAGDKLRSAGGALRGSAGKVKDYLGRGAGVVAGDAAKLPGKVYQSTKDLTGFLGGKAKEGVGQALSNPFKTLVTAGVGSTFYDPKGTADRLSSGVIEGGLGGAIKGFGNVSETLKKEGPRVAGNMAEQLGNTGPEMYDKFKGSRAGQSIQGFYDSATNQVRKGLNWASPSNFDAPKPLEASSGYSPGTPKKSTTYRNPY